MNELKPCPFCGEAAEVNRYSDIDDETGNRFYWWSIGCVSPKCDFNPVYEDFDTEAEAHAAWNRRDGEAAARAEGAAEERRRITAAVQEIEDVMVDWGNYYVAAHELWAIINPGEPLPPGGGKVPKRFRGEP